MGETGGVPLPPSRLKLIGCGRCLDLNVDGWKFSDEGLGGGSCCCCSIIMCWLLFGWLVRIVVAAPPGVLGLLGGLLLVFC